MGCRKTQATLTTGEKQAFVNAVLKLKNETPSQMGLTNRYDDYVQVHMNAMTASPGWAHQLPAFLPWHREFLRHFELDLQAIDPTVTIPYWNWTVDQDPTLATSPFTNDFLGGDGSGSDNKVTTGPFAQAGGNWKLNINSDGNTFLSRQFDFNTPTLPSTATLNEALNKTLYDVSPYNSQSTDGLRNFLEGWATIADGAINSLPPNNHNRVHVWVGGSMLPMTSPNDPVFWLNHCNIDRLWGVWQAMHPLLAPYLPVSGAPTGHNLNDTMIFHQGGPAPWPDTSTPASVVNNHLLGYWYDTDKPSVSLLTPSVSFVNVQQGIGGTGITTYRAIKFECESCGDVLLEITAGPTTGFGAPVLSETVHPNHDPTSGLSPSQGALIISYTSAAAASSISGSVTVRATDVNSGTIFGPWVVNLSANTVARLASAISLVLDRSGSMSTDAGNGHQRVELLRTAVATFIDLMQQGDGLSIVRFDNLVDTLMPVTDVGAMPGGAGRMQAQDIVTTHDSAKTLDPRGSTSIGGGIVSGKATLDAVAGMYPNRAMIVLTDGLENTAPMISDVSSSLNDHTFAIGFGQAAAISTSALNAITQNHGGYLIVTGPISPEENFALTEYFLKIQAGINNSSAVLDPRGELIFGVTHRIPFQITTADFGVDIILLSPAPYYIDFKIESPDGTIIDPTVASTEAAISFINTPRVSYYRASLPMLAANPTGSYKGQWHVLLSLGSRAQDGDRQLVGRLGRNSLPYSLLVNAYSNLEFHPNLLQSDFEPGAKVQLTVAIDQYKTPLSTPATIWAEVKSPDNNNTMVMLAQIGAGRYSASFVASIVGVYSVRILARGVTLEGQTFHREQHLTALVFIGGNNSVPKPTDNPLCDLIRCFINNKLIDSAYISKLSREGFNLKEIMECLYKNCEQGQGSTGGEKPYYQNTAVFDQNLLALREEERRILMENEQKAITATAHFATLEVGRPVVKPNLEPMIENFGIKTKKPMKDQNKKRTGRKK